MRILFVTQHFAPHFEGGTEAVVRAAAEALVDAGHELLVLAGRDCTAVAPGHPEAREQRRVGALDVVHVAPRAADGSHPLNDRLMLERPALLAALLAEVDAFEPDLVHVHHFATLSLGLVPALAARGLPVVASLHDLFVTCPRFFRVPPRELGGLACPAPGSLQGCPACIASEAVGVPLPVLESAFLERRWRFRQELDAAALLLAPSQSHARRLEAELELEAGRIGVVENGLVAPLEPAPGPGRSVPGPGETLRLVYFGHRARVKGLAQLVAVLAEVARRVPERPLELRCLGAGLEPELDAELLELAAAARAEGLGLQVVLGGTYRRVDLPSLVADAHLAVFPSRAPESYGLVVDEALALGLPVLCSDSGALAERLPPGAGRALVAPRTSAPASLTTWVEALVPLAQQPALLEDWRAAIPDRIPGRDDLARRLLELYDPLLP